MIPVKGTLDYRCFLGAPWRIDFPASELSEIPYHVILDGSAVLEGPEGSPTRKLTTGDILLFPHGFARALHGGSDAAPAPGWLCLRIPPHSRSWKLAPGVLLL
jgi:AraC family transcriptional activator of mtrCDE